MNTINQQDVYEIIASEIPEVDEEMKTLSSRENLAATLQLVVNYVRDKLSLHEIGKAQYCIALVGWLYGVGNDRVRELIEHLFVRSFNSIKKHCNQQEWTQIERTMPNRLLSIYSTQNEH